MSGGQPEWEVEFQADGKAFRVERVCQWNQPELGHIVHQAESNPEWFWGFAAKAITAKLESGEVEP